MDINQEYLKSFHSKKRVSGLTHNYYRYPARFSPEFVKEIILKFSKPNDYVLDTFMGGGTTIVEAIANGRNAIGFDISPLAYFITHVKTTPLSERDKYLIIEWANNINLSNSCDEELSNVDELRNVPDELKKTLVYISTKVNALELPRQKNFAKCILLGLGQWMLDCYDSVPSPKKIQNEMIKRTYEMIDGLDEFVTVAKDIGIPKNRITGKRNIFIGSADNIKNGNFLIEKKKRIKLIVTSPPYPGVHVLYHRWQVNSRKETSAPFWLAGLKDGKGEAYYTMGGRSSKGLSEYFIKLNRLFSTLKQYIDDDAIVIQLVAFADLGKQLPEFLKSMNEAGYQEVFPLNNDTNTRISRNVPNRKWYTNLNDISKQQASIETILFHKPI
jgi:DNA modification methylase